jgi:hypothetical protein
MDTPRQCRRASRFGRIQGGQNTDSQGHIKGGAYNVLLSLLGIEMRGNSDELGLVEELPLHAHEPPLAAEPIQSAAHGKAY